MNSTCYAAQFATVLHYGVVWYVSTQYPPLQWSSQTYIQTHKVTNLWLYFLKHVIIFFKLLENIPDFLLTSWPTFQIPDFFQTFQIF